MAEQRGRELRDEKSLKVTGGGEPINADEEVEKPDHGWLRVNSATAVVVQKHCLALAFLSLLLLLSIASAEVSSDDRCDDGWETGKVNGLNMTGRKLRRWLKSTLNGFQFFHHEDYSDYFGDNFEGQDFGRDTNRLDYFRVSAFDVHENDHVIGNGSFDHGGGRREHGMVVGQNIEQDRDGSIVDMAQQVPDRIIANDGSDSVESVVQRLEPESDGCGGGDGDNAGDLVVVGWWEKWWVWLALWKIV